MWLKLCRVFQAYERLDPRKQLHRRICANFQHDRQIGDPDSFRRELWELLIPEPPRSGLECDETVGRNTQDTGASPTSSPSTGEPPSSPGVPAPSLGVSISSLGVVHTSLPVVSAKPPGGPAPSPGELEDFDIYCRAVERKYRKQSNYRRTHPRKSSVPRPDSDLPDTDSDSTVENDDRHNNYEERFFDVDSGSYIAPSSEKMASKASLSEFSSYPQRSSD